MQSQGKPHKPFKIVLLLGVAAFGVGIWLGANVALESEAPAPEPKAPMQVAARSSGTPMNERYEGQSFSGHYLAGRFAESLQNLDDAADYMDYALQREPDHLELMQESLRSLVAAARVDQASDVAEKMLKKKSVDPLAAIVRMVVLAQEGKFEAAQKLVDRPADGGMYHVIKPTLSQWLKLGQHLQVDRPIELKEALERSGFLAPFIHYQLALMNDMASHKEVAKKHYKASLSNPDLMPYRLVQAVSNFYLRQGKKAKAQKVFDTYAKQNPTSELIPEQLPQGDREPIAVVPLVETPVQGIAEILFTTASLLFGEQVTVDAMVYLQLALYLRPDFSPAQLMLANLQEQIKDHEAAIETYAAIDPSTVFYKRGRFRTALNYQELGNHQKALGLLKQLEVDYPQDPEPLMTLGDLYRSQNDFKQAAYFYSQALERMGRVLKASDWPVLYARGIAYERSGEWGKAEEDLKQALELSPNQPDVLNYLGYSWLVQHQNLAQAKDYIAQALEQRPGDAHIIDSMGWAHYALGEYEDAVHYLEQAAELTPQDPTINDHLGDAYWQIGRQIEARFQWQRALTFEPENEAAIREKIASGLTAPPLVPHKAATKPTHKGKDLSHKAE